MTSPLPPAIHVLADIYRAPYCHGHRGYLARTIRSNRADSAATTRAMAYRLRAAGALTVVPR